MSTTVIASRHRASLYVLPVMARSLDREAVRQVLARHGVDMIDGEDLAKAHEFIAAENLDPAAASALADDLRGAGLAARVVNRVGLTTSARVGNALGGQMMVGMVGVLSIALATQIAQPGPDGWEVAVPLLTGMALILLAFINVITLNLRSGLALRVAGVIAPTSPHRQLVDQLSFLQSQLPGEMAAPLVARAERLVEHARTDPHGKAAAELATLVEELRSDVDDRAAEEAKELREEVARARRAIQETRRS